MGYKVNQVRQVYVANKVELATGFGPSDHLPEKGDLGEAKLFINDEGGYMYFEYRTHNGVVRTDEIPLASINKIRLTKKEQLRHHKDCYKITIPATSTVEKQNVDIYVDIFGIYTNTQLNKITESINFNYDQSFNLDNDNFLLAVLDLAKRLYQIRENAVQVFIDTAGTKDTIGTLVEVKHDMTFDQLKAAATAINGLVLKENQTFFYNPAHSAPTYRLSFKPRVMMTGASDNTNIVCKRVKLDYTNADNYEINGPVVADMERFHFGFRGDEYQGLGQGYKLPVGMVADPTQEYDALDIHYAHLGSGTQTFRSEKDITLYGKYDELKALLDGKFKDAIKKELHPAKDGVAILDEC